MTSSSVSLQTTTQTRSVRKRAAMRWSQRLSLQLAATDTLIVAATVLVGHLALFGAAQQVSRHTAYSATLPYPVVSLVLAVLWLGALAVVDSRDEDEIGTGTTEYRRIIRAGVATLVITIVLGFFLGVDLSRVWAGAVVPVGTLLLVAGRWIWRRRLMSRRAAGLDSHRVVLLGSTETVVRTALDLARQPGHGFRVVGVALTDGPSEGTVADLRIVGGVDDVPAALHSLDADTVMATSSDHLPAERIRDLAWHLEPQQHLVVAPSLTDVGGSRIHLRPVAGLPLIHVETPHQAGIGRVMKRLFDIAASAAALVLLAPVLAVIAVLVQRDSAGGVIYRQERVGRNGEPFSILKFRSMSADADVRRASSPPIRARACSRWWTTRASPASAASCAASRSTAAPARERAPRRHEPRRPARRAPSEVSEYDRRELRRLAVTPGLSGLWQVSGRSDLDWADGIRLDLYYVENWSMTQDLQILWRTAKAVVSSSGAY